MADHVNMMRTPKATREYIERIASTVWDDGVKAGRSATDPGWYIVYMQGFLAELERAAYILIDQMQVADHVNMMRTPKATREYIERIASTVWDDGVKAGRSATDPGWYIVYMQGFLAELERAAYILIDQMQASNDGEENGV